MEYGLTFGLCQVFIKGGGCGGCEATAALIHCVGKAGQRQHGSSTSLQEGLQGQLLWQGGLQGKQ